MQTSFDSDRRATEQYEHITHEVLRQAYPTFSHAEQTDVQTDKLGVDYLVHLADGSVIRVDIKYLTQDRATPSMYMDLHVEFVSTHVEGRDVTFQVGWTVDSTKETDDIIWIHTVDHTYTRVDAVQLRNVTIMDAAYWGQRAANDPAYGVRDQSTNGYHEVYQSRSMWIRDTWLLHSLQRYYGVTADIDQGRLDKGDYH